MLAVGMLSAEAEAASGFQVSLDGFDGPFDLLLGLIAKRRMDITTVALAEVTDEFITYVRTLDAQRALDESSNFVFVAATLLDMKLVQLLPGSEVESEEDVAVLHTQTVNIRTEMAAMADQLRSAGACQFQELVAAAESRLVVVVRFLGLLELFRDRTVEFDQEVPLGELTITWAGEEDDDAAHAIARAAEEWDGASHE